MFRCAALVLATAASFIAVGAAQAQSQRPFPAKALRGELIVQQPPEVLLNGRAARLAPGARIRGEDNLLQMSGALSGRKLMVHFTLDDYGLLRDVWVLTPAELARKPWPSTPAEAAAWRFDAAGQIWQKP